MKKLINIYHLIQRIPKAAPILVLILLAGLVEGIGVSALVPVLSSLTGEFSEGELPVPFNLLPDGMMLIGITPGFGSMLLVTLIIMLGAFLLIHIQERVVFNARYRYLKNVRDRADDAIFKSRWENIASLSSGSVTNIIIHESERGAEGLLALMTMLAIIVQLLVYSVFAFMLSWQMFMVAMITVVLAASTSQRLIRAVRALGKKSVNVDAQYSRQFVEFIRGAKLLKATGISKTAVERLQLSNADGCDAKRKIVVSQSLMKFELQAIISIAMVGILYMAVVALELQVSVLLVFMFIIMRIAPKFTTLQGQYYNYTAYLPALEIVDKVICDSEEMVEPALQNVHQFNDIEKNIIFDNVSYCYNNAHANALNGVSLKVGAREFIALVGKSGSGKSTALDLIMGIIEPSSGIISIDGVDLKEIDKDSYRRRIGFVSQDSIFFVGSIRENLCFGLDIQNDEEHIWECLQMAQIDDFIRTLPDSLDTEVGEAGIKLSGGQKQRLAIARALIRRPALLILDEATSALDSESEARFQKAIQVVARNYTIVVVAHRLSTIRNANRIYVLKDGSLIQEGNYDSLRTDVGIFSELVDSQALGQN